MKIGEAEAGAEVAGVLGGFVVAWQNPNALPVLLEYRTAAIQAAAEGREVAGGDVNVSRLRDCALEGFHVTVNVAEDLNFHRGCSEISGGATLSEGFTRATTRARTQP